MGRPVEDDSWQEKEVDRSREHIGGIRKGVLIHWAEEMKADVQ